MELSIISHWSLVIGHWSLVIGQAVNPSLSQAVNYQLSTINCQLSLVIGYKTRLKKPGFLSEIQGFG
jgi:hypothetical protein